MNKIIVKILFSIVTLFLFAGTVLAANSTSIRLQQPQSPINKNDFDLIFVALDTNQSQTISVQCYKKGPTDSDYIATGSIINIVNGGNTDKCDINGGVINQGKGTYYFKVVANGSIEATSNIVSVEFNNEGPGTPVNYSKTKPTDCTYKISFTSAEDDNKTVRVELYRSTENKFNIDSSHKVNSINIGSKTDGIMTDNISPDCNKTYYYVLRAYDKYGNGSGLTGDTNSTTTTISTTTTTETQQGAIEITGASQSVLGETKTATEASKEVLGVEKNELEENTTNQNPINWIMGHKKISLLALFIIICIAVVIYRKKSKNK